MILQLTPTKGKVWIGRHFYSNLIGLRQRLQRGEQSEVPQEFPYKDIWRHINAVRWEVPNFDIEKAFVCSLLSELTYYRVPDFELKDANRVSVIPCLAYQRAIDEGVAIDLDQIMRSLDLSQFFVVVRRYVVVVGIYTPRAIIVAIRGTKYLYDWLINLWATKRFIPLRYELDSFRKAGFHSGFVKAISDCIRPILHELVQFQMRNGRAPPIIVTGHSLGGALAAILHTFWSREHMAHGGFGINGSYGVYTDASYTFGMPRYGNKNAMAYPPYHLYNEYDIVPTVPPRFLGFENCPLEFTLNGKQLDAIHREDGLNFFAWIRRLITGKGIENHAIEVYRERIRNALNS